ncbi:MAG: anti-sigma-I factor RsgI family protein [Coriobacteriales bacterium]|jgi:hypothetical protein
MTTDEQVDRKLKDAFEDEHAPEWLKERTLSAIEEKRDAENAPAMPSEDSTSKQAKKHAGTTHRMRRVVATLAVAACFALAFIGVNITGTTPNGGDGQSGGAIGTSLATQAIVGIDINPSLELTVEEDGAVTDVRAVNDDAEAVLESVDVVGKSYDEALAELFASEELQPYLTDQSLVEIDVLTDNDELASQLMSKSSSELDSLSCEGNCMRASEEDYNAAKQAGMGMGRYRAACELIAVDPSVTLEECSHMSMRELRDRIDACSDDESSSDDSDDGSSASSGNGSMSGQGHSHGAGNMNCE